MMFYVRYQLELLAPIIMPALEGEPNSAVSLDYIAGSAIRGLLIGKNGTVNLQNADTRRLFFSDEVLFLNATPMIATKNSTEYHASYPVPATWRRPKYQDIQKITDSALNDAQFVDENNTPIKPKTMGDDYVVFDDGQAVIAQVERAINVHTQRYRHAGVAQQVFRYEALAKKQAFMGDIRCKTKADADQLHALLQRCTTQALHIGGSRSAGYGRVQLFGVQEPQEWQPSLPKNSKNDTWIITLVSPMILRTENGQYIPDANGLRHALQAVGVNIKDTSLAVLDTVVVGGFNNKWGLPLPQTGALCERSVFKIEATATDDTIKALLWNGLGERRNEGFGQVLINWQSESEFPYVKGHTQFIKGTEAVAESPDGQHMLSLLEKRVDELTIEQEITRLLYSSKTQAGYKMTGPVTRTQLGNLRHAIRDELRKKQPSRKVLLMFFNSIKDKVAEAKYSDSKIGGVPMMTWLAQRIKDKELGDIVLLRYIDGVLERRQKEMQGEG